MNKVSLLQQTSTSQVLTSFSRKKPVVNWLLNHTQENIEFTLQPSVDRFNRPDDFIFIKANKAACWMMGRALDQLIGQKLTKVLSIHPFHSFFQNYLVAFLYEKPLEQSIRVPLLARKNKKIVHQATANGDVLKVVIQVVGIPQPEAKVSPPNHLMDATFTNNSVVIKADKPNFPPTNTLANRVQQSVRLAMTKTSPKKNVLEPTVIEAETALASDVSQQVSLDGKIEYMNQQICQELELAGYQKEGVFMQDILHKVSQLPYQFALLRAKTQQVVQDLPLIFVTKSKKYVKVKGRIEPRTQNNQVTSLRLYLEVLQNTPHFHMVSAFGKVPAFNSF